MKVQLKKLQEQVMVITGASSGIGLVTARMAAQRGAKLIVTARSEESLRKLVDGIRQAGGEAAYVVADVTSESEVEKIADAARTTFGGFDTWVNNAGVSIYGSMLHTPIEDQRRLFETNFWGTVYGSLAAARHFSHESREKGGAIINVGSTLSDRAIPWQGMYSASKHAVKGFTDALRMELETEGAPISVTLIKPAAIATPYTEHAQNYLPHAPKHPAPVYSPEVAAEVILHCAETPERDMFAGGGGKFVSLLGTFAPRLADKVMEKVMFGQQQSDSPARQGRSGLYQGSGDLRERGHVENHVAESSLYTKASLHPVLAGAAAVGIGWALASSLGRKKSWLGKRW